METISIPKIQHLEIELMAAGWTFFELWAWNATTNQLILWLPERHGVFDFDHQNWHFEITNQHQFLNLLWHI